MGVLLNTGIMSQSSNGARFDELGLRQGDFFLIHLAQERFELVVPDKSFDLKIIWYY